MTVPTVIYEDPQIIVLDKPAGFVTMPGPAHEKYGETLAGWLLSRVGPSLKKVGLEGRLGIVHRLDKDTSGLMVCAKVPEALLHLTAQFKKREVKKKYLALVWEKVTAANSSTSEVKIKRPRRSLLAAGKFTVNAPIVRNPKNRMKFCAAEGGKEAITEFRALGFYSSSPLNSLKTPNSQTLTLLEARPSTGRTHQIRVHLKHIGHPIVGDYLYSGRKRWRFAKNVLGLQRQFLHASSLSFKLLDGTVVEFESELPEDLQTCLQKLRVV